MGIFCQVNPSGAAGFPLVSRIMAEDTGLADRLVAMRNRLDNYRLRNAAVVRVHCVVSFVWY